MAAPPHHHTLRGACSCGRNQYAINLPSAQADSALIIFDESSASRRAHSSPFVAYVSIPLTYYQSATFAFYPDETHQSIRKTWHVPLADPDTSSRGGGADAPLTQDPSTAVDLTHRDNTAASAASPFNAQTQSRHPAPRLQQRHFCGFCGTHFAAWDESSPDSADRIKVALESVEDSSYPTLYALGLLQDENESDEESSERDVQMAGAEEHFRRGADDRAQHSGGIGRPYFENMVGGSRLGRIRRTIGTGAGKEWEVVEVETDDGLSGKRKREVAGE